MLSSDITLRALYEQALQDFPFPQFQVGAEQILTPETVPDGLNCDCTFEPSELVMPVFGLSIMEEHKNLWGWGVIRAEPEFENSTQSVSIFGVFDVADKDNWEEDRIYSEDRAFFGDYAIETRCWSFHFGH